MEPIRQSLHQVVKNCIEKQGSSERSCPHCGKVLKPIELVSEVIGKFRVTPVCKCEAEREMVDIKRFERAKRNGEMHEYSDDDQMVRGATLAEYETAPGTIRGFQVIQDFTRGIKEWGSKGIYLFGENGLGKSHLLSAATKELRNHGFSVVYTTAKLLIAHTRKPIGKWEYLNAYRATDVLIIDELGAEIPADWEMGELFTVLNGRQNRSPILYGSNFTVKELEARFNERQKGWGTRLMERIIESSVLEELTGDSRRFDLHIENTEQLNRRLMKHD
ncbi:ATP-binding protein [Brevibacillus fortis]|uniref:ATP-binding protein n=1 Tax=Brevibacillus fortis TaxID=2126352 RepID=UPI002E1A925E|nr:ATP-binding protein [Brevibacillus fortis]